MAGLSTVPCGDDMLRTSPFKHLYQTGSALAEDLPLVAKGTPFGQLSQKLTPSSVIKGCWQLSGGHRGDRTSDRTCVSQVMMLSARVRCLVGRALLLGYLACCDDRLVPLPDFVFALADLVIVFLELRAEH